MTDLLAALLGQALLLGAAMSVTTADLPVHGVGKAHVRLILAGFLITAAPAAVPVLASALAACTGGNSAWWAAAAAVFLAAGIGITLPPAPRLSGLQGGTFTRHEMRH